MTTITARTRRAGSLGRWGLVGSTALMLLVVGAAAVRLAQPHTESPAAGERAIRTSVSSEGAVPLGGLAEQQREEQRTRAAGEAARVSTRGGLAELYAEQAARARAAAPTVYIVESQERAQAVRAGIAELNAYVASLGQPPLTAEVVWFGSPEAEAEFLQGFTWALGVPAASLPVVDLRERAAGGLIGDCGTQVGPVLC
jgi:hypothetical protein